MHSTVVTPTGNTEFEGGTQNIVMFVLQSSVAVGGAKVTWTPVSLVEDAMMLVGQKIWGGVPSPTTRVAQRVAEAQAPVTITQ